MTTPLGASVLGFTSAGDDAIEWVRRLRSVHHATGHWPLIMEEDTPEYLENAYPHADPAGSVALAATLDGAAILAARGERLLGISSAERAAKIRAQLRCESQWPSDPRREGFALPSKGNGPAPVTVAMVPAAAGWQVPAVLHYGGWNDYPDPAEHAAILRYWQDRFGAALVVMTGTTAQFWVERPPLTRPDALALAWEYEVYNDGSSDFYGADTLTDLAASLLGASVWRAWWD